MSLFLARVLVVCTLSVYHILYHPPPAFSEPESSTLIADVIVFVVKSKTIVAAGPAFVCDILIFLSLPGPCLTYNEYVILSITELAAPLGGTTSILQVKNLEPVSAVSINAVVAVFPSGSITKGSLATVALFIPAAVSFHTLDVTLGPVFVKFV